MIWWLLRKGPTRSHSELGRETFLRQWYFGLSRGRVGNCQIFPNPNTPYSIPSFQKNKPSARKVFFVSIPNIITAKPETLIPQGMRKV